MAAVFHDAITKLARTFPNTVAAIDGIAGGGRAAAHPPNLTYAELYTASERIAQVLALRLQPARGNGTLATCMHRGNDWYCVYCAAALLQAPIVALSRDLPDKEAEMRRNSEVLSVFRPELLIVDAAFGQDTFGTPVTDFDSVWQAAVLSRGAPTRRAADPDATLCFCYTGGTTKASRCARVTHRMAIHEIETYPTICGRGLKSEDRCLQQHSVYWAAATFGEIDVALAFGCALVFCEAPSIDGIAAAISKHSITFAGLVPSIMSALDPPTLPSLHLVFSWGEALPPRVAQEWKRHVHLIDVLISTECWLSFYADWGYTPTSGCEIASSLVRSPPFRAVRNTGVWLRPVEGSSSGCTELLVSGPMVSPGYSDPTFDEEAFVRDARGTRWYRTRDTVERQSCGGFCFTGRADDLIKVGGAWVDVCEQEQKLESIDGVSQARIACRRAFAVLKEPLGDQVVPRLQLALPPGFPLFATPSLPRHPATGKVDSRRLEELVGAGTAPGPLSPEAERKFLRAELMSLARWTVVPVGFLVAGSLVHSLHAMHNDEDFNKEPTSCVHLAMQVAFDLFWRSTYVTYMMLSTMYLTPFDSFCRSWIPFGPCSVVVVSCVLLPTPLQLAQLSKPDWFLLLWLPLSLPAFHGLYWSLRRGRALSWPLVAAAYAPVWFREAGGSWYRSGLRNTTRWYWSKASLLYKCLSARLWNNFKSAYSSMRFTLAKKFRIGRLCICGHCQKQLLPSAGRAEETGDKKWYCDACWRSYYRHRQCTRCKAWCMYGRENKDLGGWLCDRCNKAVQEANQPNDKSFPERIISFFAPTVVPLTQCIPSSSSSAGTIKRRHEENGAANGMGILSSSLFASGDASSSLLWHLSHKEPRSMEPENRSAKRMRLDYLSHANGDVEMPHASIESPGATSFQFHQQQKGPEWKLVERATGYTFDSTDTPLLGLDSLRAAKVSSLLRREAGVRITHGVLRRCQTLGDLLQEISTAPQEQQKDSKEVSMAGERRAWGMMWARQSRWVIVRDSPLSEVVLRRAVQSLIQRHPVLRANLCDPMTIFTVSQQSLTVLRLCRRAWPSSGLVRRCLNVVDAVLQRGFWYAWPTVMVNTKKYGIDELPLLVLPSSETREAAHEKLKRRGDWIPPIHVTLAPFKDGALIRFKITHMFCDAFCFLPLLTDLSTFVDIAEAEQAGLNPGSSSVSVPSIPDVFSMLERRLLQTLQNDDSTDQERDVISSELPKGRTEKIQRTGEMRFALLRPETVNAIRGAARRLAVSEEIAMLTLLGISFAKLENNKTQPIVMVAPMRDELGASDVIGLLADFRQFNVCTDGLSFAGVALRLHHVVKERLWKLPSLFTQWQAPWVNFEWTELEKKNGFLQVADTSQWASGLANPIQIAVDQPNINEWRMRVNIDEKRYPAETREGFLDIFEWCLDKLVNEPLSLVWR